MAQVWSFPHDRARTLHQIGKTFRCGCVIYNANQDRSKRPVWTFATCEQHQQLGAEFPFHVLIWDGELEKEQDQDQTPREWP